MLRDFTLYLPDNSEFTFRRGYSYLSEEIDGKMFTDEDKGCVKASEIASFVESEIDRIVS